jgi:DNA-binding NarL/FixJ family response regulator
MENSWPEEQARDRMKGLYHPSTSLNNSNAMADTRSARDFARRVPPSSLISPRSPGLIVSAPPLCIGEAGNTIVLRRGCSFLLCNSMARTTPRESALGVCLISRHPLVLEALQRPLTEPDFHIQVQQLGGAPTAEELQQIPIPPATVYVLDAHASNPVTEAMATAIRKRYPESYLVLVAEKFDQQNASAFLRLGAKGLLRYTDATAQLARALEAVAAGGLWVPRALLSAFVDSITRSGFKVKGSARSARLSPRETQVLDGLLENRSNKEIAANLKISERTVKFHVSNVLEKFGVGRRADLVLLWYQEHHN